MNSKMLCIYEFIKIRGLNIKWHVYAKLLLTMTKYKYNDVWTEKSMFIPLKESEMLAVRRNVIGRLTVNKFTCRLT